MSKTQSFAEGNGRGNGVPRIELNEELKAISDVGDSSGLPLRASAQPPIPPGDPRALPRVPRPATSSAGPSTRVPRTPHRVVSRSRPLPVTDGPATNGHAPSGNGNGNGRAATAEPTIVEVPDSAEADDAPWAVILSETMETQDDATEPDEARSSAREANMEAVRNLSEDLTTEAIRRAGSFVPSDDESNELLDVICFLEGRTIPEIVEALVKNYFEERAEDTDVQAVLEARKRYNPV